MAGDHTFDGCEYSPFYPGQSSALRLVLFTFALCSGKCLGIKSLCFVLLGQSQRAEVMCHCHPGPERLVHPCAHLGSSQRMGKALCSYGPLGVTWAETFSHSPGILYGNGWSSPLGVWLMCPHHSCLLSNYCMPHSGWEVTVRPGTLMASAQLNLGR